MRKVMTELQREWKRTTGSLKALGWVINEVAEELDISYPHLYAHMALGVYGRPQISAFVNWLITDQIEPDETVSIDKWFRDWDERNTP